MSGVLTIWPAHHSWLFASLALMYFVHKLMCIYRVLYSVAQNKLVTLKVTFLTSANILIYLKIFTESGIFGGWCESGIKIDFKILKWESGFDK